ncbi:hypothetical protein UPYG_G00077500 [Umbra pygmaea]|uniref:G-protein coupled receptors family 1 profile domain-containing protein n=1 Tax=Umbra pygmaea TaxID=75934 RepID=A0ABD0XD11_UMBPY
MKPHPLISIKNQSISRIEKASCSDLARVRNQLPVKPLPSEAPDPDSILVQFRVRPCVETTTVTAARSTVIGGVKEAARQPQTVFTVRHATVTFQTDGDTWREQKEKKAALMVGILIGVFVLCWIPFFLAELITPLCRCNIPPIWKSIFLWLGYSNSFFNPLIYTAFNKNYNNALRNLFSRQR